MGQAKTLAVEFQGLVTAPGLLMRSPASCTVADNCILDVPGVMRKRQGYSRGAWPMGAGIHKLHTSPLLNTNFLVHEGVVAGTGMRYSDGQTYGIGVVAVDGSACSRPANLKQQMAVLGYSHFLTSSEGLRRMEGISPTLRFAGMPRGLAPTQESGLYNVLQVANPWLSNGNSVAYRVTWHRLDAYGLELGGAPTGRAIVRNIAGTAGFAGAIASVSIRVPLPKEFGTLNTNLTTSYFYRLWRSRQSASDPDDVMFLVDEKAITATDITNGYAVSTDVTPDNFLIGQATLHTNSSNWPVGEANLAQGVLNEDAPPPVPNSIAQWNGSIWTADFTTFPSYVAQLLGVQAGAGGPALSPGDTVSLDGVNTMTAVVGAPGANQFSLVTTLATLSLNVEATARNICDRHNSLYASSGASGVCAYYTSQGAQSPGQIFVETKQASGGASPATSRATAWRLPTAASVVSGANRIRYSKPNRGDAFAPCNELQVGPTQSTILRLVPYRDRLLVFTDVGIYQAVGGFPEYSVAPFDLTYRLRGRELVAVCDDRVYAWCWEGIVEIDEGGVRVISSPIEPSIEEAIISSGTSNLASYGFAYAYRLRHRVVFMHPPWSVYGTLQSGCVRGFVFDTRTRAWSTMSFDSVVDLADNVSSGNSTLFKSCAAPLFATDAIAFGWWNPSGGDGRVMFERLTFTSADYIDTDAAGVSTNFRMECTFQFQVPEADGAVHWQQTVIHFDAPGAYGPFGANTSWRQPPSDIAITYQTESGIAFQSAATGGQVVVRIEPLVFCRRGNRLRYSLVNALTEACGFVGVSQTYRVGSQFANRSG